MKPKHLIASILLASGSVVGLHRVLAQEPIQRTDVLRHELNVPGREVMQVRVDFPVGTSFGRHSHPGAEIAYVLEGELEYRIDGQPPVTLRAGEALFIPSGAIHGARNVGKTRAAELATYIVETGKPILRPVE